MTDLIKSVLWAIELFGGLAILPIIYDIDVAELGALGLLAIGIDLGVHRDVLLLELLRLVPAAGQDLQGDARGEVEAQPLLQLLHGKAWVLRDLVLDRAPHPLDGLQLGVCRRDANE